MTVSIRAIEAKDRAEWNVLYQGYADFYGVPQDDQMRDTVFGWIMDDAHEVKGLVADKDGTLIGLTHYRPYASPLRAVTNCFLDDLFVAPDARGSGAAQALIGGVEDVAKANGWSLVRWITAEDNARARKVYDQMAQATPWVTYDLK